MENILNNSEVKGKTPGPKRPAFFLTPHQQDLIAYRLFKFVATLVIIVLILLVLILIKASLPAISEFGFTFVTSDWWNPVEDEYGGLAFIYGTVVSSFLALMFATPVSIGVALFITEVVPEWAGKLIGTFVELIAAVPSIVLGLWGIFYLSPFIKDQLSPFLKEWLGFVPLFQGPSFGIGMMSAALILALMITPTITSICREVFRSVPVHQKEAALALGATRFEMYKMAVLKPSFSGMMGGVVLGLGRALGETMAVAMVIGNQPQIKASLFAPAATMASVIANEYAEADSDLHLSALCLVGVCLFVITLIVNLAARFIVHLNDRSQRGGK